MSKAHLNYRQIKKYIKILVINGLVVERNNFSEGFTIYHTTDKGKSYLEMYEESKAYNFTSNIYVFGKQSGEELLTIWKWILTNAFDEN